MCITNHLIYNIFQMIKNFWGNYRYCDEQAEFCIRQHLTFLGLSKYLGLAVSLEASNVTSRFEVLSNIRKKLLYEPVMIAESLPLQQHSNLSKIQSFSYSEHSLGRRYSCTWNKARNTLIYQQIRIFYSKYQLLTITWHKNNNWILLFEDKLNEKEQCCLASYWIGLNGFGLHVQVPHFDWQIISWYHVTTTVGEFDITNGGDDFTEETPIGGVFWLLKHCGRKAYC